MEAAQLRQELMHTLVRFKHERYLPILEMDGLTPAEARFILLIHTLEDKVDDLRPNVLAEASRTTPSAASQMISSLTTKGLIERRHRSDDYRAVYVVLTPTGRLLAEKGLEQRSRYYDALIDYLGEDEVASTIHTLERILEFNGMLADEGRADKLLAGAPVQEFLDD